MKESKFLKQLDHHLQVLLRKKSIIYKAKQQVGTENPFAFMLNLKRQLNVFSNLYSVNL